MEVNGFFNRSELVNKGVMDKAGELTFSSLRDHHGSSSFFMSPEVAEQFHDRIEKISVPCISLDEYFHDRAIDVLKIDAEGAENNIIAGGVGVIGRSPQIKILMEYTARNRPAVEQLLGLGFNLWNIEQNSSLKPVSVSDLDRKTDLEMLLFARE
jgi:FkbM family methyltransferase